MTNAQKQSKSFYYMYGKHAVLAALSNKNRIVKQVYCTEDVFAQNKNLISKFRYEITNSEGFTKIIGPAGPHQGIAAYLSGLFSNEIRDIETIDKVAILDQITDPQNIGAIIRNAAAFNFEAIIIPADNAPDENSTIAKAASGALELVQIIKVPNLRNAIEFLKKNGFWIIGLDGHAKEILDKKLISSKMAIVLGSEDQGLRRLTKENCDHLVKIPISHSLESLNVSAASAIVFHLFSR